MTDSIIVYRNPIEKMFWESFDGIWVIYILAGMIGAGLGMYAGLWLFENKIRKFPKLQKIILFFSTFVGAFLGYFLMRLAMKF
jgi:hypothetical protein